MKSLNRFLILIIFLGSSVTQNADLNNLLLEFHLSSHSKLLAPSTKISLVHTHKVKHGHPHGIKPRNHPQPSVHHSLDNSTKGSTLTLNGSTEDPSNQDNESHEHDHCFSNTANSSIILELLLPALNQSFIASNSHTQFIHQMVNDPHLQGLFRPPRS